MICFDHSKCVHCGICADNCSVHAIAEKDGQYQCNNLRCFHCNQCVSICPTGAVTAEGMEAPIPYDSATFDIAPENLLNSMRFRRSIRRFTGEKLTRGELELLLVKKITRARVPGVILKYKEGRYKELPDLITCLHPKEVRIRALDGGMTVNFDGETRVVPEITFRLSDRRIPLILPKGVRP